MAADISMKYFKDAAKNSSQMEELTINVVLMLQQQENFQKALDKIFQKLDCMEERQLSLEQKNVLEEGKKEGKKTIIEYLVKYWWVILISLFPLLANQPYLTKIISFFTLKGS